MTSSELVPEASDSSPDMPPERYRLVGWRAQQLCHDLAAGEKTQVELAAEHGVTQPAIAMFKARNAARIAAVRERLDDEFAGLWIAQKRNRVAEYQSDVERINAKSQKDGATMADADMLRVKGTFLKAVAEELGQLPARVNVSVSPVVHILEGVSREELT